MRRGRNQITLEYRGKFNELVSGAEVAGRQVSNALAGGGGAIGKIATELERIGGAFQSLANQVNVESSRAAKELNNAKTNFTTSLGALKKEGHSVAEQIAKDNQKILKDNLRALEEIRRLPKDQRGSSPLLGAANQAKGSISAYSKSNNVDIATAEKHLSELANSTVNLKGKSKEIAKLIGDLFSGVASVEKAASDELSKLMGMESNVKNKATKVKAVLRKAREKVFSDYEDMLDAQGDLSEFTAIEAKARQNSSKNKQNFTRIKSAVVDSIESIVLGVKEAQNAANTAMLKADAEIKASGRLTKRTQKMLQDSQSELDRQRRRATSSGSSNYATPANRQRMQGLADSTTIVQQKLNTRVGPNGSYSKSQRDMAFQNTRRMEQIASHGVFEQADNAFNAAISASQQGRPIKEIQGMYGGMESHIGSVRDRLAYIKKQGSSYSPDTQEYQSYQMLRREAISHMRRYRRELTSLRNGTDVYSASGTGLPEITGESVSQLALSSASQGLQQGRKEMSLGIRRTKLTGTTASGAPIVDASAYAKAVNDYGHARTTLEAAVVKAQNDLHSGDLSVNQAAKLRKELQAAESLLENHYLLEEEMAHRHQDKMDRIVNQQGREHSRQLKSGDEAKRVGDAYSRLQALEGAGPAKSAAEARQRLNQLQEDQQLLGQVYTARRNSGNETIRQGILGGRSGGHVRTSVNDLSDGYRRQLAGFSALEFSGSLQGRAATMFETMGFGGVADIIRKRNSAGTSASGSGGAFNRANNTLYSTINKRFGQFGGLAGLPIYGLGAAGFGLSAGKAGFNASVEAEGMKNTLGGIVNQYTELKDAGGKVVDGAQKFNLALRESSKFYDEIRQKARESILTTRELFDYVTAGAGQLLGKGLTKTQTLDVTNKIASFGKGMGLQPTAVMSDIRDFANGQVTVRSQVLRAMGMNPDKLKVASAQGGEALYNEFNKSAKGINQAIERMKTLSMSSVDRLQDSGQQAMIKFGDGLAKGIVPRMESLSKSIDEVVSTGKAEEFGKAIVDIGDSLILGAKRLQGFQSAITGINLNTFTSEFSLLGTVVMGFVTYGTLRNLTTNFKDALEATNSYSKALKDVKVQSSFAMLGIELIVQGLISGIGDIRAAESKMKGAGDKFAKDLEEGPMDAKESENAQKRVAGLYATKGFKGLAAQQKYGRDNLGILNDIADIQNNSSATLDAMESANNRIVELVGADKNLPHDDVMNNIMQNMKDLNADPQMQKDFQKFFDNRLATVPLEQRRTYAQGRESFAAFMDEQRKNTVVPVDVFQKYAIAGSGVLDRAGIKSNSEAPLDVLAKLQGAYEGGKIKNPEDIAWYKTITQTLNKSLSKGSEEAIKYSQKVFENVEVVRTAERQISSLNESLKGLDSTLSRTSATATDAKGNFSKLGLLNQQHGLNSQVAYYSFAQSVAKLPGDQRNFENEEFRKASFDLSSSLQDARRHYEEEVRALREGIIARQQELTMMRQQNAITAQQIALDRQKVQLAMVEKMSGPGAFGAPIMLGFGQLSTELSLIKSQRGMAIDKANNDLAAVGRSAQPFDKVAAFFGGIVQKGLPPVKLDEASASLIKGVTGEYSKVTNALADNLTAAISIQQANTDAVSRNTDALLSKTASSPLTTAETDSPEYKKAWAERISGTSSPAKGAIKYSDRAKNDHVNPGLLGDIGGLGFTPTIGTANTGHSDLTTTGNPSRHKKNNAVDITEINGHSVTSPEGKRLANLFVAKLEAMGYTRNSESGNEKAVLWQTMKGGNHYNHIHVSRNPAGKKKGEPVLSTLPSANGVETGINKAGKTAAGLAAEGQTDTAIDAFATLGSDAVARYIAEKSRQTMQAYEYRASGISGSSVDAVKSNILRIYKDSTEFFDNQRQLSTGVSDGFSKRGFSSIANLMNSVKGFKGTDGSPNEIAKNLLKGITDSISTGNVVGTDYVTKFAKDNGIELTKTQIAGFSNATADLQHSLDISQKATQNYGEALQKLSVVQAALTRAMEDADYEFQMRMNSIKSNREYKNAVAQARTSDTPGAEILRARGTLIASRLEEESQRKGRYLPELVQLQAVMKFGGANLGHTSDLMQQFTHAGSTPEAFAKLIDNVAGVPGISAGIATGKSKEELIKIFSKYTGRKFDQTDESRLAGALGMNALGGNRVSQIVTKGGNINDIIEEAIAQITHLGEASDFVTREFNNLANLMERAYQANQNLQQTKYEISEKKVQKDFHDIMDRSFGGTQGYSEAISKGISDKIEEFTDSQRLQRAQGEADILNRAVEEGNASLANLVALAQSNPADTAKAIVDSLYGGGASSDKAGSSPTAVAQTLKDAGDSIGKASDSIKAANGDGVGSIGSSAVTRVTPAEIIEKSNKELKALNSKQHEGTMKFYGDLTEEVRKLGGAMQTAKMYDALSSSGSNFMQMLLRNPGHYSSPGGFINGILEASSPLIEHGMQRITNGTNMFQSMLIGNLSDDKLSELESRPSGFYGNGRDIPGDKLWWLRNGDAKTQAGMRASIAKTQLGYMAMDYGGALVGNWAGKQIGGDSNSVSMGSQFGSMLGTSGLIFKGLGAWAGPAGAIAGALLGGLFGRKGHQDSEETKRRNERIENYLAQMTKSLAELKPMRDVFQELSNKVIFGQSSEHLGGRFGNRIGQQSTLGIRGG